MKCVFFFVSCSSKWIMKMLEKLNDRLTLLMDMIDRYFEKLI